MSYQFDTTALRANAKPANTGTVTMRLLSRRTIRQNRRSLRAI